MYFNVYYLIAMKRDFNISGSSWLVIQMYCINVV